MNSKNIRLSMTIKAPADVRPGEFAERLRGHINAAPGYSVERASCRAEVSKRKRSVEEQRKEDEKQKYIEQWLENNPNYFVNGDVPGVRFTRRSVLMAIAEQGFSKIGELWPIILSEAKTVGFNDLPPKVAARWAAVHLPCEAAAFLIRTPQGDYGARISMQIGPFMMIGIIRLGNETEEL